jgi:hypothetical protein
MCRKLVDGEAAVVGGILNIESDGGKCTANKIDLELESFPHLYLSLVLYPSPPPPFPCHAWSSLSLLTISLIKGTGHARFSDPFSE